MACRSDRLTGLEADAALGNKKPYYTSYRVVFTMTSSKIADGVIRDTSYLAYLTITFHTSPIHNIFIVRIADPITRGYEIIGRYENDRDEIPFRRTPNIEYLPVPASFLIFSHVPRLPIYARNRLLHRRKNFLFHSTPFIVKINCLPIIRFLSRYLFRSLHPLFSLRVYSRDNTADRGLS